jgi:hypothetical protein
MVTKKVSLKAHNELKNSKNREIIEAVVFIGLLLLAVSIISVVARLVMIDADNKAAAYKVSVAYEKITPESDTKFKKFKSYFDDSSITDKYIGSTKQSVCTVLSPPSQYFTLSASPIIQSCFLRYTSGYTTTYGINEMKDAALDGSTDDTYKWSRGGYTIDDKDCEVHNDSLDINYVYGSSQPSLINEGNYLEYEECGRPSPIAGVGDDLSSLDISDTYTVKTIRNDLDESISSNSNQIWFSFSDNYYKETLKCMPSIYDWFFIQSAVSCSISRHKAIQ